MKYYKKKINPLVRALVVVLLAVLVLSLFGVFNKKSDDEWNEVNGIIWDNVEVQTGGSVLSSPNILSTDFITIDDGVLVELGYQNRCTYSITFYDKDKNYVSRYHNDYGSTFEVERGKNVSGFSWDDDIVYFRVTIEPNDENGVIKWYEKLKYINHIKIYTKTLPEVEESDSTT